MSYQSNTGMGAAVDVVFAPAPDSAIDYDSITFPTGGGDIGIIGASYSGRCPGDGMPAQLNILRVDTHGKNYEVVYTHGGMPDVLKQIIHEKDAALARFSITHQTLARENSCLANEISALLNRSFWRKLIDLFR